jgi:broad specificity phosphatase PhoE
VTRLVLVRHGRTAWNAEGRWQGQTDVRLDDTGRAQAAAMAVEIAARYAPTALYASDLARAWETAGFVAEETGLEPVAEPLLREIFTGEWEGKLAADIEARWPEDYRRWIAGEDFTRAGGAETRAEVAERTVRGLERVIAATPAATRATATTVVVGHGASLRAGAGLLTGLPSSFVPSLGSLRNCHWVELTDASSGSPALAFGRSAGWVIEAWNVGGGADRTSRDATPSGAPLGSAVTV